MTYHPDPQINVEVIADMEDGFRSETFQPSMFGQPICIQCGWANHSLRKRCRNCGSDEIVG